MKKKNKIKIFIVGGFPIKKNKKVFGGQVTACMQLFNSPFMENYNVNILDSTQISNPPPYFAFRLLFSVKRFVKFLLNIIFKRPDVAIIFFSNSFSAIEKGLMVIILRTFQIKVLVFPRAGGLIAEYFSNPWFAKFIRFSFSKANMFLCQGLTFQRFAITELGFSKISSPIIPNWTASEVYLNIGANKNFGRKVNCPHILFLGWLEESKGALELLEAAKILVNSKIFFHLTFAGDGRYADKARKFVEKYQLTKNVTFAGWVDEKKKISLLKSCQIFTLPSWSEGLPNSMIEAMSAGLACVVTDVGVIKDFIAHNQDALVIKRKNIPQLVNSLKKLIVNQTLRANISKKAHLLASTKFSLENGLVLLDNAINKAIKFHKFIK
jgi:glycosyltransferase involved in cell wall biosynthesis